MIATPPTSIFFFFNDTATTEIYTLSLHDALPISTDEETRPVYGKLTLPLSRIQCARPESTLHSLFSRDQKSTRLNSSHLVISYAVFCLKKKKKNNKVDTITIYKRAETEIGME